MTTEIIVVLTVLTITVILLALDLLRIDIVGILCMLALAWTGVLSPLESLSGFSSNAVIAMIAVMVLGRGIGRTGLMDRFAGWVLRVAGDERSRLVALVSAAVGLMSGVIQNVGAAALFLPAMLAISRRKRLPASQIIMPIGFAAILGGTLTMVGSGPLITVNDLLANAGLGPYGLFAVTPVGLMLLAAGIGFFYFAGAAVLPHSDQHKDGASPQKALIDGWQLPFSISHYRIPDDSSLVGKTPEETGIWEKRQLNIVGITRDGALEYAPWRGTRFEANQDLAIMGEEDAVRAFAAQHALVHVGKPGRFAVLNDPTSAGFAEVVVPPRSSLVGATIREFGLRRRFAVEPVLLYHTGERVARGDHIALADMDPVNDGIPGRQDFVFHFHGFDDQQGLAGLDLLARLDGKFQHGALEGGLEVLAISPGRGRISICHRKREPLGLTPATPFTTQAWKSEGLPSLSFSPIRNARFMSPSFTAATCRCTPTAPQWLSWDWWAKAYWRLQTPANCRLGPQARITPSRLRAGGAGLCSR
mgnify:CR=1 FL=1